VCCTPSTPSRRLQQRPRPPGRAGDGSQLTGSRNSRSRGIGDGAALAYRNLTSISHRRQDHQKPAAATNTVNHCTQPLSRCMRTDLATAQHRFEVAGEELLFLGSGRARLDGLPTSRRPPPPSPQNVGPVACQADDERLRRQTEPDGQRVDAVARSRHRAGSPAAGWRRRATEVGKEQGVGPPVPGKATAPRARPAASSATDRRPSRSARLDPPRQRCCWRTRIQRGSRTRNVRRYAAAQRLKAA
jgi:hypothetical protein